MGSLISGLPAVQAMLDLEKQRAEATGRDEIQMLVPAPGTQGVSIDSDFKQRQAQRVVSEAERYLQSLQNQGADTQKALTHLKTARSALDEGSFTLAVNKARWAMQAARQELAKIEKEEASTRQPASGYLDTLYREGKGLEMAATMALENANTPLTA